MYKGIEHHIKECLYWLRSCDLINDISNHYQKMLNILLSSTYRR